MMVGYQLLWRSAVPIIAATSSGGLSSDQREEMERPSPSCEPNAPPPNTMEEPRTQSWAIETNAGPTAYLAEPCLWSSQEALPSLKVGVTSRKSSCEGLAGALVSDTTSRVREEHSLAHSPELG